MPTHDFCQYIAWNGAPTIAQVLDANRIHALCAHAQCFSTESDAFGLVGAERPWQHQPSLGTFVQAALAALAALALARATLLPRGARSKAVES